MNVGVVVGIAVTVRAIVLVAVGVGESPIIPLMFNIFPPAT